MQNINLSVVLYGCETWSRKGTCIADEYDPLERDVMQFDIPKDPITQGHRCEKLKPVSYRCSQGNILS
jgi:hypothetical protein